ncbi:MULTISPECIES: terminase large subunit [Pseudomonas]|uniref:Phage terminase, large subunit n=1 Tax=Pseudomonas putida (strain ATCC 47054 / DSM 6125 / CFBP 8728 / NCIMB 11950 / KT2440) TaxID=160488 RepID=Q88G45_PSEPK|nr:MULTISPECIES: terminase TerL endonuclease subunit [Pseudomonas]AAN69475.1 putative Phage terminase, large subunit [Pseudomonas putida KT2440]KMU94706.1 terminase [Pseudomonas putida]KMY31120.1 terminase [Pseudomonas putida]MDD2082032.1 terminase large subunit [Pseudomonas putida]QXZ06515.1 terminase large subunit [Pseudomonas putida]
MSQKKTSSRSSSVDDPATQYAKEVHSGERVAGPDIRNACARHLRDLEEGPKRGLTWDLDAANKAIRFYRTVLKLNGGEFEGLPFELLPWQKFIVGSIFGWKSSDGYRRFRVVYVESGKGSGKSPLAAGVGLTGLIADNEARAEIYAAATKKDQAMILFRDAVAMVQQSPELTKRLVCSGTGQNIWNLAYLKSGSFFRPISSDDGQSGPRPHMALIDEVHEHKTNMVVEMMRAGTKSRKQALIFMITNSGSNKRGPCWEYHEYGSRVASGALTDDGFFAYICSLDEGDDPIQDESCWFKSNPSLQDADLPGMKYLREQVTEARGMPSKEAMVRRLNFCEWTGAESPWISWDVWSQAEERVPMSLLRNRPSVGGLDLSSTTDLTSFVLLFYPTYEDPHWRLLPYFWIPDHELDKREARDKVPYAAWIKSRDLETTPGRAISKLHVLRRLQTICDFFQVDKIAFDRWRIEDMRQLMSEYDITLPELVEFGQGFKDMGPAVDEFERRLLGMIEQQPEEEGGAAEFFDDALPAEAVESLRHDGNPVMTWCAGNAVIVSDPANNRKADKAKATGRIDGIIAAIMATGISGAVSSGSSGSSIYDEGVGV